MAVQRSSSLRNRVASNRSEHGVHGKPPKPPEGTEMQTNKNVTEDEKEKDMKNSGAQGAILRKKKTKRRSTGIVQYNQDVSVLIHYLKIWNLLHNVLMPHVVNTGDRDLSGNI